ncbi:MAG: hypothetical protein IPL00_03325 [Gammaproteobacteria bacterium]|nr:hypothetical protein [Gammaproteobacteria bacterium]
MNAITTTTDINEAHRLARGHAETAVQYAIRCGELERMTAEHATGALKVYLALLFDPVAREYFKIMNGYANRKPQA